MSFIQRIREARTRRVLIGIGVVAVGAAALAGIVHGPALLDYYRFAQAVEEAGKASTAKGGAWPRLEEVCMPCHGTDGNPASQQYARLAGQPKTYLVQQLTAFASGERANPTMSPLALDLTSDEIDRLAIFYAAQAVTANAPFAVDPVRVKNGERLAKSGACAACHGRALEGLEANPRLAGQGNAYLAKQLRDFKSGARRDPQGVMVAMTASLSDDDIEDLSHYLAAASGQADK